MQFSASLLGKGSDGVVPDRSRNSARVDAGLMPWSSLGKVVDGGSGKAESGGKSIFQSVLSCLRTWA